MFRETAKFVFVMPLQDPEWNPDGTQIDDMAAAFDEIMDQFVDVISDSDCEPASCGGLALDPPASDPDASSLAKNQDRHYSRSVRDSICGKFCRHHAWLQHSSLCKRT